MSTNLIVLAEGYCRTADFLIADGTCTLIKTSKSLVLVDTLGPWSKEKLKQLLDKQKIHPNDIDVVVGTHGHPDHIGNLNLFTHSKQTTSKDDTLPLPKTMHIVGHSVYHQEKYFMHDFLAKSLKLDENISVIATPGHTATCVSVVCDNVCGMGKVVISGDLFENEYDVKNDEIWLNAGSENPDLQRINRNKILSMAEYIVPGHGKLFKVIN